MKKLLTITISFIMIFACTISPVGAEVSCDTQRTTPKEITLEEIMDAWEHRDMARLDTYYEALSSPFSEITPDSPTIVPYWQSGGFFNNESKMCHQKLAFYGFLLYISDMQNLYLRSLNQMGYTLDDLNTIMEYAEKPDVLENDLFTYKGHFYDPDTNENWRHETNPTAKTRTFNHYDKAIAHFKAGSRTKSMQELGMALHYLQDINEPHHASNKIAKVTNHSEFEAFVTPLVDDIVEMLESNEDASLYAGYLIRSVSQSAHEAAVSAKQFVDLATDESAYYETRWTLAAIFTIAGSMSCTSGLLYRFAIQTQII